MSLVCLSPDEVGQALFDVGHGLSDHEQATAHVLPLSPEIPDGQGFHQANVGGFDDFVAACEAEQTGVTCYFPLSVPDDDGAALVLDRRARYRRLQSSPTQGAAGMVASGYAAFFAI